MMAQYAVYCETAIALTKPSWVRAAPLAEMTGVLRHMAGIGDH
jgi:hypothetical protein